PIEITNRADVQRMVDLAIEKAVAAQAARHKLNSIQMEAEEATRLRGFLADVMDVASSRAPTLYLQDAALLHLVSGGTFRLGETVETAGELPNPMGGPPFHGLSRYTMTRFDPATGSATIDHSLQFDRASSRQALAETIDRMAGAMSPKL